MVHGNMIDLDKKNMEVIDRSKWEVYDNIGKIGGRAKSEATFPRSPGAFSSGDGYLY